MTPAAQTGKSNFQKSRQQAPHARKTNAWKRPGEKQHLPGRRSRPKPRGGRKVTGPEEEGPRPTSSLVRGPQTESTPEAKTRERGTPFATEQTGRPQDDTRTPRGKAGNCSQEPNCSNSFIRDQIKRSRPDRGTPS